MTQSGFRSYGVCLEEMEGRWIAHVPQMIGCFSTAATQADALAAVDAEIQAYTRWRQERGESFITVSGLEPPVVEEIVREWTDPNNPDYVVNAFFAHDATPLTLVEAEEAARLLGYSREDLLASVADLTEEQLDQVVENGWSIQGILNHTGRAEWWYLDRLGLAPNKTKSAGDRQGQLNQVRQQFLKVLPQFVGLAKVVFVDSELWSPRKVLRRALWHERDHTAHIRQFRQKLGLSTK